MHELETVRSWERNPQVYADALGTSLAGQALFNYASDADRARRVVSKLRQTSRLVQAARDNIRECPGIFVKIGLETWRGVLKFIEADLPARVFEPRRSPHSWRSRGHLHRSRRRDQVVYRVPRNGSRSQGEGVVSSGPGKLRAKAEAR